MEKTIFNIIKNGAVDRNDTIIISDYFLEINKQQYPLQFIEKALRVFLPEYLEDLQKCFHSISTSNICQKHYENMALSAKQIICAIYISKIIKISNFNLYLFILAIIGRHCYFDINQDKITATNNFIEHFLPNNLTGGNISFIKNVSIAIHPSKRNLQKNLLTRNMSDAILMPTFGISWELFYNDIIRIERERMIKMNSQQCILFLKDYFNNGWLGELQNSVFSRFPDRLIAQLSNK